MVNNLSYNMKKCREDKGIGVRELSRLSDLAHSTIVRIENGTAKNPTINIIIKIAKALDVSLDELVLGKE